MPFLLRQIYVISDINHVLSCALIIQACCVLGPCSSCEVGECAIADIYVFRK